ncbi:Anti-sigma-K factor RskA [Geodermatophilus siccatus]|uniref:Anti-sigma-K factor RskA n=1 Tax=Geodermatophilus siccatus TaxID=1137991 RepID=A0A1G9Z650_9ACTN|nr:anti-sigma factor [Geodermatophilus siccatus]SDN16063.1 Anti-sigma-K factor RskA [Geodermatophilus siccatus]
MRHCTPEQLALAALHEPLPADDATHLDSCAQCREEVASLRRAVDALAVPQLAAPGAAVPPPPGVWAGIAAATGVTTAPRPEAVAAVPAGPPPAVVPPAPTPTPAPVVPLRTRRSRLLLAVAASLVVGVGIGAGAVALGTGDDDGQTVAAAALDPLDDGDATGEARVLERDDGTRVLEVDLSAADPDDGFYEVWLIDEEVERMYSLGVVQGGGEVTVEVPPGVDLTQFPVVDVSVEKLDGDPRHSGVSVARGVLA